MAKQKKRIGRRYRAVPKNGKGPIIEFVSAENGTVYGFVPHSIRFCTRGEQKYHRGYKFYILDEHGNYELYNWEIDCDKWKYASYSHALIAYNPVKNEFLEFRSKTQAQKKGYSYYYVLAAVQTGNIYKRYYWFMAKDFNKEQIKQMFL